LPLAAAVPLLLWPKTPARAAVTLSIVATVLQLLVAIGLLLGVTSSDYEVYRLGDWPVPYGIVLVLDRLSALMLVLTAVVALASQVYSLANIELHGRYFHTLFQFQLMGLNGAFLTGDLFNLFVFFEILLIASYGLLLHGAGPARTRAALHYVILNLIGSSLFLIALGIIYGVLGTLNMAHLAALAGQIPESDVALLSVGALLLLVVFALKAALLPLYFWLPSAYTAATAPVAALFAIMTKVGVYSIVRVYAIIFGAAAGPIADLAAPWLLPVALATVAFGTIGALASHELRRLVSYLVIVSVGTLLAAVGLMSVPGLAAAIYYLVHSTMIAAALFLLADLVARQRGQRHDRLIPGPAVPSPWLLGSIYFAAAVVAGGLPPLSGFVGKAWILQAGIANPDWPWLYGVILPSSLFGVVVLSRAGSCLFWHTESDPVARPGPVLELAPVIVLLTLSALMVLAGGPLQRYAAETARDLRDPSGYIEHVLGTERELGGQQSDL
jgi:multicomponent K+:H+ antiporter subunit D